MVLYVQNGVEKPKVTSTPWALFYFAFQAEVVQRKQSVHAQRTHGLDISLVNKHKLDKIISH